MATVPVSQGEVLRQIDKVKHYLKTHDSGVSDAIFQAMDGLSRTFLSYKKGSSNWASEVVNAEGNPLWLPEEAAVLSETLPLAAQTGGGLANGDLKFTADSSFVKPAMPDLNFSIDEIADSVKQYITAIDEKNRQLSEILGPVAIVKSKYPSGDVPIGPYPPYIPTEIPIPGNTILVMINAVLETCRLIVSNHFFDVSILRQILSLVLSIFDVLRGNWKDGVMTFMGVFSSSWMVYGMIGKTTRWVYNFMAPDIQQRIESDLFAGGKSMLLGAWLWMASVVSPSYVRDAINQLMETAKQPLEVLNQKIAAIEQQAQASVASIGAKVEFPRIPLDKLPSFDDIQNFQTILHQPEVYCSPAFKEAMNPALEIPIIRVVFELLNIPTTDEGFAKACANQSTSLADAMVDKLKPTVTLPQVEIPQVPELPQTGGKRRRKTQKRGHSKKSKSTRRRT
jgi:hypothetical protein